MASVCLSLIKAACELDEELKGNYEDCARLLERCGLFKPLAEAQATAGLYQATSEPAFVTLSSSLKEILAFAAQFKEPTYYQTAMRVAFRKTYAEDIVKFNALLTMSAEDLGILQTVDFELRRRQDIEVRIVSIAACIFS